MGWHGWQPFALIGWVFGPEWRTWLTRALGAKRKNMTKLRQHLKKQPSAQVWMYCFVLKNTTFCVPPLSSLQRGGGLVTYLARRFACVTVWDKGHGEDFTLTLTTLTGRLKKECMRRSGRHRRSMNIMLKSTGGRAAPLVFARPPVSGSPRDCWMALQYSCKCTRKKMDFRHVQHINLCFHAGLQAN